MKTTTIIALLCGVFVCYGYTGQRQTENTQTDNKQVAVIWTNNETIVKAGVYSDTTDIDFPSNVSCEQGKHFVRWERANTFPMAFVPDSVGKIAYTAVFADNESHNYTINHYKEIISDTIAENFIDNYELASSEQKQGAWGSITSAVARDYDGYMAPVVNQQLINENDSTVVNIYYDRKTYSLSWNTNGGIVTNSFAFGAMKYGTNITVPQLVRPGYSYKWDMPIPETLADNSSFTAIWTANKYNVKWLMNNGTDSVFEEKLIDYETEIKNSGVMPHYAGHEFIGWGNTPTSSAALTDLGIMTAADTLNKTFYAIWEPNVYEVVWFYNSGDDRIFQKDSVSFDSVILPPAIDPVRDGFLFSGWGQEFNSDTAITDFDRLTDAEDHKYYALWEPYTPIIPTAKADAYKPYSPPANRKNRKMEADIAADTSANIYTSDISETVCCSDISVNPNPTGGKAYYQNPNMKIGDVISIYDDNGKLIIKQTVANAAVEEIDLQNQPRGVYFIELNGEQLKIIKM